MPKAAELDCESLDVKAPCADVFTPVINSSSAVEYILDKVRNFLTATPAVSTCMTFMRFYFVDALRPSYVVQKQQAGVLCDMV